MTAAVVDLAHRRRVRTARRAQQHGCPISQIVATTTDTQLAALAARWELIALICHLTGATPAQCDRRRTSELEALRERYIGELMSPPHSTCDLATVHEFTGLHPVRRMGHSRRPA
jgi:hypothetical protein